MIKFIGRFKDLIPMGYRFQKLYAMDYKVYHKKNIWIWVAGRSVQIDDLSRMNSASLAQLVLSNKYPVRKKYLVSSKGIIITPKGHPKITMLDRKTGKIYLWSDWIRKNDPGFEHNYDTSRFREYMLTKDVPLSLKELHDKNMIQILHLKGNKHEETNCK